MRFTPGKTTLFTAAFLFFGLLFSAPPAGAAAPAPGPMAETAETTVTFPPVIAGTAVTHGFVVNNTGTASLEILNVYTG